MRLPPVIIYTAARIGLFVICAGLLWAVGARGLLFIVLAFVVSGLLSFVLLSRLRDKVSTTVFSRAARTRERMAERTRREDEADDEARSAAGGAAVEPPGELES